MSRPVDPLVVRHDALAEPAPFGRSVDLVVGNPPFLAQRRTDTARGGSRRDLLRARFGDLGPYVDDAAAFLLVGVELLEPGGVCVMLQPQSTLAARDASAVRDRLLERSELVALWADDRFHFEAAVHVCAVAFRMHAAGSVARSAQERAGVALHGAAGPLGDVAAPLPGDSWGPLLATVLGTPSSAKPGRRALRGRDAAGPTVGDVATVTAGFRDEFYALAAAALSHGDPGWEPAAPLLVTCGMLDLCRLDVRSPRRLAGRRVVEPRLDLDSLAASHPRVATWVSQRSVPKVLLATQTKVPEVVVDAGGTLVPVTPVISVEPVEGCGVDVWHLAAALSTPSVALDAAADRAGSGLSAGSLRFSAAWARSVPLPTIGSVWDEGAALVRRLHGCTEGRTDGEPADGEERSELLVSLGRVMEASRGRDPDPEVMRWWIERADPPRRRQSAPEAV